MCTRRSADSEHLAQVLAIHDGFKGTRRWAHFLETQSTYQVNQKKQGPPGKKPKVTTKVRWTDGLDRVALDSHRYLAFTKPDISPVEERIKKVVIIRSSASPFPER